MFVLTCIKMLRLCTRVLKVESLTHKLQYAKTLKGEVCAAFLGVFVSVFVGYLSLLSLGGSSVDLKDLSVLMYYFCLVTISYQLYFSIGLSFYGMLRLWWFILEIVGFGFWHGYKFTKHWLIINFESVCVEEYHNPNVRPEIIRIRNPWTGRKKKIPEHMEFTETY